eukprot:976957-Pleurochrysis_carterae.AAC.1
MPVAPEVHQVLRDIRICLAFPPDDVSSTMFVLSCGSEAWAVQELEGDHQVVRAYQLALQHGSNRLPHSHTHIRPSSPLPFCSLPQAMTRSSPQLGAALLCLPYLWPVRQLGTASLNRRSIHPFHAASLTVWSGLILDAHAHREQAVYATHPFPQRSGFREAR